MNIRFHTDHLRLIANPWLLLACCISPANGMTVSGPITANGVTVSGDVAFSSMTVSSLTVTSNLDFAGPYDKTGLVLQMKYSSSTAVTTTANTSWTALSDFTQSISLSSSTNHVRITLSGGLYEDASDTYTLNVNGFISIFRDSTNLGNSDFGFTSAQGRYISTASPYHFPGTSSAGITIVDSPGDTFSHIYQVYMYTDRAADYVAFPKGGAGFLILEEISGP